MREKREETASGAPLKAERRHLGGGVVASIAAQVVALFAYAVASVVIARILGPSGTGSVALATTFYGISLLVVGFGIKQSIVVLVGSGRWEPRMMVRDLAVPLIFLWVLGTALGIGAYELARGGALEGIPSSVAPLLAAAVGFGIAWQWAWSLALARERYEAYAVILAAAPIAVLVLASTLAAVSGTEGAVAGFAAAQVFAGLAGVVWAVRFIRNEPPLVPVSESRLARLRRATAFGLQTWAAESLQFVNFRFDLFFLAAFAATADVGVYSVAATVTAVALILPQALSAAVLPRSAALEGAATRGEVELDVADLSDARACRHTVLMLPVSGLIVTGLLLAAVPLLYGSEFEDALGFGLILMPGILLLGLAKVMSAIIVGRGKPRYILYTVFLTVPPTVAGYLLVIPDSGATGAAIVSAASYALSTVIAYFYFRRATGIGFRFAFVPTREDARAYGEVAALLGGYLRAVPGMLGKHPGRPGKP